MVSSEEQTLKILVKSNLLAFHFIAYVFWVLAMKLCLPKGSRNFVFRTTIHLELILSMISRVRAGGHFSMLISICFCTICQEDYSFLH